MKIYQKICHSTMDVAEDLGFISETIVLEWG